MRHVTMHLWQVPAHLVPAAVARMGIDRLRLRGTPGLGFAKLLGTGDGRTFSPRDADPRTWGLLCAWASSAHAAAFEAHPTPRGWRRIALEEWRGDLVCLRTKGQWAGRAPFTPSADLQGWRGPIASVTRARLVTARTLSFWRAVPAVVVDLDAVGPLLRVGIGEAPVGLQGTFTIWSDADVLADFAYQRLAHRRAIADTRRLGWYAEELFARFAVVAQRGTVGGAALPLSLSDGAV